MLHRHVAEALETEYAADRDDLSGQIAVHYETAGLVEQALVYYRRAAAYARQLYAHDVAIGHLQAALALIREQPHPQKSELYDLLGEIQHFVGKYKDARDSWVYAIANVAEADRLWQANLYRKVGNAWRDEYHYDEALGAYDDAEKALGGPAHQDDDNLWSCWGQIELERLNVFYWLGRSVELLNRIANIQQRFERHASTGQQARLHQISAIGLIRQNRYSASPQAVEHARAYLSMLQEMGDSGALPAAHFQLGFITLWATDDLESAEREMVIALSHAEHSGDVSLKARCLTYLTVIARLQCDTQLAQNRAEQSLAVANAGHMNDYIGAAHGNLAWVAWRGGEITTARMHGRQALEAWGRLPANYMFEWIGRWPLIALAIADDKIHESLSHAIRLLDESQKRMPEVLEQTLVAATRAADMGDQVLSRTLLKQAAATAGELCYL